MQTFGVPTLPRKAGPSISGSMMSRTGEFTPDVALLKGQGKIVEEDRHNRNHNQKRPSSMRGLRKGYGRPSIPSTTAALPLSSPPLPPPNKPSSLTELSDLTKSAHNAPETPRPSNIPVTLPSNPIVTALNIQLDSFLHDVVVRGYVLEAGESPVRRRGKSARQLMDVEQRGCSSVRMGSEMEGFESEREIGIDRDEDVNVKEEADVDVETPPMAKEAKKETPSRVWRGLGSRGYWFVSEERGVWK